MEFGVDDGGDGRARFQGGVDGVDALALGEVRGREVVVVVGGGDEVRGEEGGQAQQQSEGFYHG